MDGYQLDYEELKQNILSRKPRPKQTLERNKEFMKLLGDPQSYSDGKYYHIAGTNGKGSVSLKLMNIFALSGLSIGLYTSPHITSIRERIRINSDCISKETFTRIGNYVLNVIDTIEHSLSFYDIITAMAFIYFQEMSPDIVILETGLGGRLDATNILNDPILTVITSIGWDHMNILGDNLNKITKEKAGILRDNHPVVLGPSAADYIDVIRESHPLSGPINIIEKNKNDSFDEENCKIAEACASKLYLPKRLTDVVIMSHITEGVKVIPPFRMRELIPIELQRASHNSHRVITKYDQIVLSESALTQKRLMPDEYYDMVSYFEKESERMITVMSTFQKEITNNLHNELKTCRIGSEILKRLLLIRNSDERIKDVDQCYNKFADILGRSFIPQDLEIPARDMIASYEYLMNIMSTTSSNGCYYYPSPRAIIIDSGHNSSAIQKLLKDISMKYEKCRIRLCISLSKNRDITEILKSIPLCWPNKTESLNDQNRLEESVITGLHYLSGNNEFLNSLDATIADAESNKWKIDESLKLFIHDELLNNSLTYQELTLEQRLSHACCLSALNDEVLVITGSMYIIDQVKTLFNIEDKITDLNGTNQSIKLLLEGITNDEISLNDEKISSLIRCMDPFMPNPMI